MDPPAWRVKRRRALEQAHQQLKVELGLDHFQGRSWPGLHHHALLALIAFAFLQHLRLREAARRAPPPPAGPPPRPSLPEIRRTLLARFGTVRACPRCAALGRTGPRPRPPPEVAK